MGSQGGVCTDKWDDLTYILKITLVAYERMDCKEKKNKAKQGDI